LLAGVSAPADDRQVRVDQSRQLLSAFNRIEDSQLRQELLVLIEIVSTMPELLQRKRKPLAITQAAQVH
jgi:hypothetical protein